MKILYTNARIVPMTGEKDTFSCMGVENGKITYLGGKAPAESYDRTVDLEERFVYPTLTDSHLHLLYSIVLSACSFNICRMTPEGVVPGCMEGVEKEIRAYAQTHPGTGLIMVNQFIASAVKEGRLPNAGELDVWTGGREIVVFNIDFHSCSVSTALSGKLGLKTENGILSGEAFDMHQGEITGYASSQVDIRVLAKGLAEFTNTCLSFGITRVCALDGDGGRKDPLFGLLVFLARRMDLDVRLFPQYLDLDVLKKTGPKMRSLRIGGCGKWELDGSVGSHSAAFYHPYKDTGASGTLYHSGEEVEELIRQGLENGVQTSAHAIGTAAIDQIVEAYLKSEALLPKAGPMARIDHFEFPSEKALSFVKEHRIAVTLQPGYAYLDKRLIHSYDRFMDPADIERIVPLKELADAGVKILGSSDSPVQSVHPYEQMRGMMDYYDPARSLSAYEAFATYTVNAGEALGEEDGCLAVGAPANFFVSRQDILQASADTICDVRAEEVYLGGKRLKRKKGTVGELLAMLLRFPKKI